MHRQSQAMTMIVVGVLSAPVGCATFEAGRLAAERKAFRDDLVVEIAEQLVAVRDEHRRDATAQQNTIAELSSGVYALEQRIEEVEKARERGETAITDRMTARLAIPSHQSVARYVADCARENNRTLRGEIGDFREMVTQRLSADESRITNLELKTPDPDRADRLLEENVRRAVGSVKVDLAGDLRNDVDDLRRDINNRTVLEGPVGAMLESWKRKEGIADLQSTNEYIIPAGVVIALILLGNAGLALRQRDSKETEEALRTAGQARVTAISAMNAADLVRDDVNTLREQLPRPRKRKAKEPKRLEKFGDESVGGTEERNKDG